MSEIWDDENLELEEESSDSGESILQNELVKRISKAKLYESLLSSSFFDEEDVEDSIKKDVEKEIKGFIVLKLEELLGLKSNHTTETNLKPKKQANKPQPKSSLGLTEEEMMALKMVAKKITTPQAENKKLISKKKKSLGSTDTQVVQKEKSRTELELSKSANVSRATGQNYAQVNNPDKIPQPSQEVINQLMQAQASRAFSNFSGGNSPESQIIAAAIGLAQQKNKNVRED
ncbi:hypothetical protein EBU95_03785 [bacterium]|nr:hypothetical protein [bacterium]